MTPLTPPLPSRPLHPGLPRAEALPLWATSADGLGPATRPQELDGLGLHLRQCTAVHARLDALQCGLLRLRGWVLGRLVSSIAVLAALAALALVLLAP